MNVIGNTIHLANNNNFTEFKRKWNFTKHVKKLNKKSTNYNYAYIKNQYNINSYKLAKN